MIETRRLKNVVFDSYKRGSEFSSYETELRKIASLQVTNSKVKLSLFRFRVTNLKVKNKKILFELLTLWVSFFTFIFSVTSYEREVRKYQITFGITDWKTEKKDSSYFILYTQRRI